jgi:hypothetical protein
VGVMARINVWVACTLLGGGMVGRRLGWTVVGGIGAGLTNWRNAW